jgi:hypothetical protein
MCAEARRYSLENEHSLDVGAHGLKAGKIMSFHKQLRVRYGKGFWGKIRKIGIEMVAFWHLAM